MYYYLSIKIMVNFLFIKCQIFKNIYKIEIICIIINHKITIFFTIYKNMKLTNIPKFNLYVNIM